MIIVVFCFVILFLVALLSRNHKIYYLDNNATTLIYEPTVKNTIVDWLSCGNPSNTLHAYGQLAHNEISLCHKLTAKHLSVSPDEIYFTSGATESNNLIIQGVIKYYLENYEICKGLRLLTSSFEHPSVINIFREYENMPEIKVTYINPYKGRIWPEQVEEAIRQSQEPVILISIMYANNETGAIQDIPAIGKVASKYGIFFHTDATQAMGKYRISPRKENIDALSFSGHKFHGPKGVGGIYLSKRHHKIVNLCYGGEQESSLRPGTENVANIAGMTAALMMVHKNREAKNAKVLGLKKYILNKMYSVDIRFRLLGADIAASLPNTLLLYVEQIDCNTNTAKALSKKGVFISTGSACQTGHISHVTESLGLDMQQARKVLRISLSDYSTREDCDKFVNELASYIKSTI